MERTDNAKFDKRGWLTIAEVKGGLHYFCVCVFLILKIIGIAQRHSKIKYSLFQLYSSINYFPQCQLNLRPHFKKLLHNLKLRVISQIDST